VISLTDLFDDAARRHNDVILLASNTQCLVTTFCSSSTVHRHTAPIARAAVELLRQETPNVLAPNPCPPKSPDLSPVDYEIWGVTQHRALPQTNP